MTLQIPPSALVKTPGSAALPGALLSKTALPKGRFLALFSQKLDSAADDAGVISRLASLLQNGMPMATLTNRIAAELTNALARAVGEPGDAKARSTLQRALAAALAPPGSGPPPGSPHEQAAMLERRVKDLLTKLTSELNTAGQKSEFSGNILDAKSAKDTPAPQKSTTTPVDKLTDDVAALVQSLLNGVADGNSAQTVSGKTPAHSGTAAVSLQPNPPLPDLLTRMVARAVNAETQRNPSARVEAPAQPASANAASHAAATAAFQRMIAIIAEHGGAQTGARGGNDGQTPQQKPEILAAPQPAASAGSSVTQQTTAAAPAFAAHLLQPSAANVQTQAPTTPYVTVDPNAIVEQIVKGIVVHNAGAASQVRLRLQPEQLGDVTLKLTVTGNTIAANVVAQNAHVRDMLMANQHQLARSLANAGLSLGNFSVDVSGGNAGFTGQGSHQQHSSGNKSRVFGAMLIGEDESWGDTRFGPPVVTGPKPIVLNYLA